MTRPRPAPSGRLPIGAAGLATTVVGAVLVLVSFTTLTWYDLSSGPDSAGAVGFGDLHTLTQLSGGPGLAKVYFSSLGWLLLVLVILAGLAASVPSRGAPALRGAGLLIGLAGALVTYLALDGLVHHAFRHAQAGVYLALVGFVCAGIGAALAPPKPDQPRRPPAHAMGSDAV